MKDMPRFRTPTAADDLSRCQGVCGRMVHYEDLDSETGLCGWCKDDEDADED